MRKRTNTSKVCSSDNYESSNQAHKNMLKRNHQKCIVEVHTATIIKKRYYTKVFGKIIDIKEEELHIYESSRMTIYTY